MNGKFIKNICKNEIEIRGLYSTTRELVDITIQQAKELKNLREISTNKLFPSAPEIVCESCSRRTSSTAFIQCTVDKSPNLVVLHLAGNLPDPWFYCPERIGKLE